MFLAAKWFGHDVGPIKISANFNDFDESLLDLVFKMVPFEGDVFSSDFGCFAKIWVAVKLWVLVTLNMYE
jgi:hypothetical protein